MKTRSSTIFKELIHHLPYSAVGVAACLGILLAIEKVGAHLDANLYFHITHPAHIFLSAIVTTAMFWKYEPRWGKAMAIGFLGTLPICSLSDVFFPYLGGLMFHTPVVFHLCLIEEPWLVLPACFLGIVAGIVALKWVEKLTELGHLAHVLISSFASFLYLISFDVLLWRSSSWVSFLIVVVAVWLPCCLSDIIFPLAFAKGGHAPCCGQHPPT